jgi:hypothetical protein
MYGTTTPSFYTQVQVSMKALLRIQNNLRSYGPSPMRFFDLFSGTVISAGFIFREAGMQILIRRRLKKNNSVKVTFFFCFCAPRSNTHISIDKFTIQRYTMNKYEEEREKTKN